MRYVVKAGDSLRSIALKQLGSESEWSTIWHINKAHIRSGNPNEIQIGEVLDLPDPLPVTKPPAPPALPTSGKQQVVGSDDPNEVILIVNDVKFFGWEDVSIKRSLEAAAGSFSLTVTDRWADLSEPWPVFPGDECTVKIGYDTIITGYVDDVEIELSPGTHRMTINGRDRTADIVDCSAAAKPGEWRNKTIIDIAKDLCTPLGVRVIDRVNIAAEKVGSAETRTITPDEKPVKLNWAMIDHGVTSTPAKKPYTVTEKVFRIQPGETVFEALERAAKGRRLLMPSSPDGCLVFTRSGVDRLNFTLKEGVNIKAITASFSNKERYSKYVVEGQQSGEGQATKGIYARAEDSTIKRYRPLVIIAEENATQAYATERAAWEAKIRAARSSVATVKVQGFRNPAGALWNVNTLVQVDSPSTRINAELLISDVEYKLDQSEGTTTTLTLKRKDAFSDEVEVKKETEPATLQTKTAKPDPKRDSAADDAKIKDMLQELRDEKRYRREQNK